MWILHFLPDGFILFIVYAVLALGGALTAASYLIKWIPGISAYRLPMRIAGIVMLICGVYFYGGYSTEMQWRERVAEMEAKIKESEQKSAKVNTKIKKVYVDRVKTITETKVVVQDKIIKEKELIDRDCRVPAEAINILNQAARGPKGTVEVGPLTPEENK